MIPGRLARSVPSVPCRAAAAAALLLAAGCGHAPGAAQGPDSASSAGRAALFEPLPDAEVAGVKDVHRHRGKPLCQACHVRAGALTAAPDEVCTRCHDVGHRSHPVAVVQRAPAPGLPLLAGRRVACHTCHDPHEVATNGGLRKPFGELCVSCHAK
jgi:predicted CXXCH cytochrome family protein